MQRRKEILDAVDLMLVEHDRWEADDQAPSVPTERLEGAIDGAIRVCANGDVPGDCRRLVASMSRLADEWVAYQNGSRDAQQRPLRTFWAAFTEVVTSRQGAQVRPPRVIESVAQLKREGVSDTQIAHHIYGHRGEGPFLDRGVPRSDLIAKEAAEPGSVIPKGWIHPEEQERIATEQADMNGRIASLQSRQQEPTTESATIEQLLREGANVQQIANVKGVTAEEVRDEADRLGIEAVELPNLAAMRAPGEPQITQEQDRALRPADVAEPDDAISAAILEAWERSPDAGASELAKELTERLGRPVSVRQVNRAIRQNKA